MGKNKKKWRAVAAPLVIILVGFLTAFTTNELIGEWAFIPLSIVYWLSILFVVQPNKARFFKMFRKSKGNIFWRIIAYIPAMFTIVAFVWGLLSITTVTPLLVVLSLVFIVINPVMEEMFWRGWLLKKLPWQSSTTKVVYSTVFFTLSHYCMWGVFSVTMRSTMMLVPLLIMGTVWSVSFLKSGSLRHNIIAHALVDILNLSVWVLLNLYIPPVV